MWRAIVFPNGPWFPKQRSVVTLHVNAKLLEMDFEGGVTMHAPRLIAPVPINGLYLKAMSDIAQYFTRVAFVDGKMSPQRTGQGS